MPEPQPRLISHRAADDLTYIRSAMERSSAFTAVPGAGGVVTGVIGLIAAVAGARQPTGERWLATWLGAARRHRADRHERTQVRLGDGGPACRGRRDHL